MTRTSNNRRQRAALRLLGAASLLALAACDAQPSPSFDLGAGDYCEALSRCRGDWFAWTFAGDDTPEEGDDLGVEEAVERCSTIHARGLRGFVKLAQDPNGCGLAVEATQLCRAALSCSELEEDLTAVNNRQAPPHCELEELSACVAP